MKTELVYGIRTKAKDRGSPGVISAGDELIGQDTLFTALSMFLNNLEGTRVLIWEWQINFSEWVNSEIHNQWMIKTDETWKENIKHSNAWDIWKGLLHWTLTHTEGAKKQSKGTSRWG